MKRPAQSRQRLSLLRNVSVCSSCKRASCAQAVFPCTSPSRALLLPIETLRYMDRELEEFWTAEWANAAKHKQTPAGVVAKEIG